MNKPTFVIIHCSATKEGKDFTSKDVDKWHRARGFRKIGYHYLIRLDGTIEVGRGESEEGAHAIGFNRKSVGICYVGGLDADGKPKDTRTPEQKASMQALVTDIKARYKIEQVLGHRDLSVDLNGDGVITSNEWMKACPCFEAKRLE